MRKRAESVDRTRERITEATVRLHTTVGPANTTISGVAEEAGVTRVTVYRHFPDEEQLYEACTRHWFMRHPPPDPTGWRRFSDLEERATHGLDELYTWYSGNAEALYLFDRDRDAVPASVQQANRAANEAAADALVAGLTEGRLVRAGAGHVVRFPTWRSLAVEQGLDQQETVQIAVRFLLAAARSGVTPPSAAR